ncbi:MATE family efflux transporter, partial [Butyrivibrio sp.]|uniref:MATE family efflux transporter n=1 Tax=Butyrivibrio sp. TaxID=28121 RepID=UPI0025C58EE6
MEIKIDNKLFYRNLIRIALPITLQSLMLSLVAAADALMLGRVAQEQMTAVSLATQIQFVQNMFIFSATSAGAILGAQYWG